MEQSDTESPFLEKKSSKSSSWSADFFVIYPSVLLVLVSIALVAIIFVSEYAGEPEMAFQLQPLQRIISTSSLTATSVMIMVVGKRYVLFKLTRGGLRSQRVAFYSDLSIRPMAKYLVSRGVELPLLGLMAVWLLAWATGLTVNDSWTMGSVLKPISMPILSGPFHQSSSNSSSVTPAVEQLTLVMSWSCLGLMDIVGVMNVTGANTGPNHPMGTIYYPPPLHVYEYSNLSFSIPTTINGFNISLEQLSSVPPTASNLTSTCLKTAQLPFELWYDTSDNQTLSIVVVDQHIVNSTFRISANSIIMGGTLSSNGTRKEFALNGTSWPNVSTGNGWAKDIMNVICNTTSMLSGCDSGSSFLTFATQFYSYSDSGSINFGLADVNERYWSSVLNMALGAYSSAMFTNSSGTVFVTEQGVRFTLTYGTYILLANIVVSIIMLIIMVRLRQASHLGPDFLNSTRLLLDPLKKPELFNASLQTTVDARGDPYMLVKDNAFLVEAHNRESGWMKWLGKFGLRKRSHEPIELDGDPSGESPKCNQ